jgi:hypothetical protein
MTPAEFALKWMGSTASERAAAQEHFIDLCRMLGIPTPNEDPTGADYAFEKGVEKIGGGGGSPMSNATSTGKEIGRYLKLAMALPG